jgi:hypothetical protein
MLRAYGRDVKIGSATIYSAEKLLGGVAMDVRFVTRNADASEDMKDFM